MSMISHRPPRKHASLQVDSKGGSVGLHKTYKVLHSPLAEQRSPRSVQFELVPPSFGFVGSGLGTVLLPVPFVSPVVMSYAPLTSLLLSMVPDSKGDRPTRVDGRKLGELVVEIADKQMRLRSSSNRLFAGNG